jgi:4'-phosphopantetheinyl transferase
MSRAAVSDAVRQLSADERARFERFVFEDDRRDFAIAHALLRRSLSEWEPVAPDAWMFSAGVNGKPELTAPFHARTRLDFNVTHTKGLVACAIGRDLSLGIDAESVDRRLDITQIAKTILSAQEFADLECCSETVRRSRFFELWTLKEAYIKARGDGLSYPLNSFGFTFDGTSTLYFTAAPGTPAEHWSFALFGSSETFRIAVAVGTTPAIPGDLTIRLRHAHATQSHCTTRLDRSTREPGFTVIAA